MDEASWPQPFWSGDASAVLRWLPDDEALGPVEFQAELVSPAGAQEVRAALEGRANPLRKGRTCGRRTDAGVPDREHHAPGLEESKLEPLLL